VSYETAGQRADAPSVRPRVSQVRTPPRPRCSRSTSVGSPAPTSDKTT